MTGTEASDYLFQDFREGNEYEHNYFIDTEVVEAFLRAFDDRSPLHTDDEHARKRGFPSRVAHGAILNGFLSNFVGMRVPGRRALLLSVELRYSQPCFLGDAVKLCARIVQRSESTHTILLGITFRHEARGVLASGRALVAVAA